MVIQIIDVIEEPTAEAKPAFVVGGDGSTTPPVGVAMTKLGAVAHLLTIVANPIPFADALNDLALGKATPEQQQYIFWTFAAREAVTR